MIADLVRNDLGHVCRPGTVSVDALCAPEEHPGLVHLVTTVSGRLRPGVRWREIADATLPPGSVSGAPKSSALRAIAELESAAARAVLRCRRLGRRRRGGGLPRRRHPHVLGRPGRGRPAVAPVRHRRRHHLGLGPGAGVARDRAEGGSSGRTGIWKGQGMSDDVRVWVNGALVEATAPAIAALDHGVTVGDGVFETCKVVDGRGVRAGPARPAAGPLPGRSRAAARPTTRTSTRVWRRCWTARRSPSAGCATASPAARGRSVPTAATRRSPTSSPPARSPGHPRTPGWWSCRGPATSAARPRG